MFLKKVKKSPVVREKMKSVAKKKAISVSLATILPNANKHYVVGNLVWVKVGSHPFWPSMVTYDPLTGDFHRDQPGKNGKKKTLYHVQYFGKAAMRGWSVSQRMFPFEGKEKFKAVEQSALHKVKKKTGMYKKIEKMFRVSAAAKPLWNEAIDEALKAFAIKDLNDRLEANVFNYYV
ncbi:putative histone-lysine N-methyltransferase NSD2, partial [Stegodyphus mimosarum]